MDFEYFDPIPIVESTYIDDEYFIPLLESLRRLSTTETSFLTMIKFKFQRNRFRLCTIAETESFLKHYFKNDFDDYERDEEIYYPTFILQFSSDAEASLECVTRLTRPEEEGSVSYGISVLRLTDDDCVIDTHGTMTFQNLTIKS